MFNAIISLTFESFPRNRALTLFSWMLCSAVTCKKSEKIRLTEKRNEFEITIRPQFCEFYHYKGKSSFFQSRTSVSFFLCFLGDTFKYIHLFTGSQTIVITITLSTNFRICGVIGLFELLDSALRYFFKICTFDVMNKPNLAYFTK